MARRKVKLAFIVNPTSRKATYRKRKKGLMKKVQELSTLCGVEACAIVYSPYGDAPEVWPSEPDVANHVLTKFKDLPDWKRAKNELDHERFIRDRVDKLKSQIMKLQQENRNLEVTSFINRCLSGSDCVENFGKSDLSDMNIMIQHKLNEITMRMAYLNGYGNPPQHLGVPMLLENTKGDFNVGGLGSSSMTIIPFEQSMAYGGGLGSSSMATIPSKQPMAYGGGLGSSSIAITPSEQPRSDNSNGFGWAYDPSLLSLNSGDGASASNGGYYPNYFHPDRAGPSFSSAR